MLLKSSYYAASSYVLKKQKHYQTPGTHTMVLAGESLFVRCCHKYSTYLCGDVAGKTTMGANYSFSRRMISFTVRNGLEITLNTVSYLS